MRVPFQEILSLKQQKSKLESVIQKQQVEFNALNARFNTLREEHVTLQEVINMYKTELEDKMSERDSQLEEMS